MNTIKLNTIGTPKVSGGNSGGGGNKSNYKYYDCTNDNQLDIFHQGYLADYTKTFRDGHYEIAPEADGELVAVAFDMSKRMYIDGEWIDAKTFFEEREGFDFSAHTEITEEEFFNVVFELPEGYFYIDYSPYQADEGMTWGEFVESSYNDGSVNINTAYGYVRQNGQYLESPEGGYTTEADTIIKGFNYQYLPM